MTGFSWSAQSANFNALPAVQLAKRHVVEPFPASMSSCPYLNGVKAGNRCMLDELNRLRADEYLLELLKHYASLGEVDREAWQDRVMNHQAVDCTALVRLHGDLLAFEWIEQNTGILVNAREGHMPSCYRVTTAGLRALKRARSREEEDDERQFMAA
jgi:hypothetical protein